MRILIAYRYFSPDTPPYASMLEELTGWFAEAGHEVEMVTAQPAYKPSANIPKQPWREVRRGVNVRRLWLLRENGMGPAKVINSAVFVLRAFFIILLGPKRDLIWTATMPPVVQAWMLSFAARMRGAKFLYHMQDLHPEISAVSDGALKKGRLFNLMQRLDVKALSRSDVAVVLSPDMCNVLIERGVDPDTPRVIRNFALGDDAAEDLRAKRQMPAQGQPLSFCFAGNVGRFQNLEKLIEAFTKIDPSMAQLVIVGEGRAKAELQAQVAASGQSNVTFHDHMTESQVFAFLCKQHVGLVSLSPGLYRYAFPSKIWTYMAADLPMLAMVEDESYLHDFLCEYRLGTSLPWEAQADTLAATITALSRDVRNRNLRPAEHTQLYHKSAARAHWLTLMDELEKGSAHG